MQNFMTLGLNETILKAISDLGFENPTPIQEKAIPTLLAESTDLVGLAQTGTGKTAAFGLPLLQKTDFTKRDTQALIICPTRELCLQITRDLTNFSKYINGANIVAVYGGASIDGQIREIARGAQVIVATPGRMVDILDRGKVKLGKVGIVVLDEADEMLNMGFKEDLDRILSDTPEEKNTWLFSATMQKEVARIAKNYMSEPLEVTVGKQNQGADNIEHRYYVVHSRDKYLALKRIVDYYPEIFGIVFCRTRQETQDIADKLMKDGYNADALHGDLSQAQRDFVMKRYRSKNLQMLVATDVAARGIDVNNVTHVINYNLPDDVENYTHRSGRTARAGKSGISIAIVGPKDSYRIREIEKIIGKKFTQAKVPVGADVCEKQLLHLVKTIHDTEVKEEEISDFLPPAYAFLKDMSKEDLIKRMVSVEFNRFLEYYRNAPDINIESRNREQRDSRERTGDSREGGRATGNLGNTGWFFVNLGEMDGFDKMTFRDLVSAWGNVNKKRVGRIDLKSSFTFFEVDPSDTDNVMAGFKGKKFNGRTLRLEVAEPPRGGGNREREGGFRSRKEGGDRSERRGGFGGDRRSGGGGAPRSPRKRSERSW